MLYAGFAIGVVWGAYETRLDFLRFAVCALILLVFALIGSRIWYLAGHRAWLADRAGAERGQGYCERQRPSEHFVRIQQRVGLADGFPPSPIA